MSQDEFFFKYHHILVYILRFWILEMLLEQSRILLGQSDCIIYVKKTLIWGDRTEGYEPYACVTFKLLLKI